MKGGVYRMLTTGIPSIRRMKEEEYRNPLPENIGRFKEAVRIINLLDK